MIEAVQSPPCGQTLLQPILTDRIPGARRSLPHAEHQLPRASNICSRFGLRNHLLGRSLAELLNSSPNLRDHSGRHHQRPGPRPSAHLIDPDHHLMSEEVKFVLNKRLGLRTPERLTATRPSAPRLDHTHLPPTFTTR